MRKTKVNEAGGLGYEMTPKEELAKIAVTGTLKGNTFYVSADNIESRVKELVGKLIGAGEHEFIGKVAAYARHAGYMKDMPAYILSLLAEVPGYKGHFRTFFPAVIDNAGMLRKLVEFRRDREGKKKNLNNAVARMAQTWIRSKTPEQLYFAATGEKGISLATVIKLAHVKPKDPAQEAMFGYLLGRDHNKFMLPEVIAEFDAWKVTGKGAPPKGIPFPMLTNFVKDKDGWIQLAKIASYNQTLMLLNSFARHGVFDDPESVEIVAARLVNPVLISKSKVLPYKIFAAFTFLEGAPKPIEKALKMAMKLVASNVPQISGKVVLAVDVSGSMHSAITGNRGVGTSKMSCLSVAALLASVLASRVENPGDVQILPFSDHLYDTVNGDPDVLKMAKQLSSYPQGGTNCSLPLERLVRDGIKVDGPVTIIYFSDNESWMDYVQGDGISKWWWNQEKRNSVQKLFKQYQEINPQAKLILNDLQPNQTIQAPPGKDIFLVGGFSDVVFDVMANFVNGDTRDWVKMIEDSVEMPKKAEVEEEITIDA